MFKKIAGFIVFRKSKQMQITKFFLVMFVLSHALYVATPALAAKAKAVSIYTDQKFSDHAPLVIDYGFTL